MAKAKKSTAAAETAQETRESQEMAQDIQAARGLPLPEEGQPETTA